MIDAATHGAPNWVDLSTADIGASLEFYQGLFGWTILSSATPMGEYHIATVGGHQVAGLMAKSPMLAGTPTVWTTYFYVADVDETAVRVRDAGGTVPQPPFDIPDGRIAIISDPTGAMAGVIAGPPPDGDWYGMDAGRACWIELLTRDPSAAEGFYAAVFGWKAETQLVGPTAYTTFTLDRGDVCGMMMMPDEVPAEAPAHWSIYFTVDDCQLIERRAVELGGEVLMPTAEMEMGRFTVLADPHGATFNLMEFAG